MLKIGAVAITVQKSDAPDDHDEFTVTGGLRIDDAVTDGTPTGLGNSYPVGSTFTGITGVLGYSFGDYKLQPRNQADVAFVSCDPFN